MKLFGRKNDEDIGGELSYNLDKEESLYSEEPPYEEDTPEEEPPCDKDILRRYRKLKAFTKIDILPLSLQEAELVLGKKLEVIKPYPLGLENEWGILVYLISEEFQESYIPDDEVLCYFPFEDEDSYDHEMSLAEYLIDQKIVALINAQYTDESEYFGVPVKIKEARG
ncbi:MAG: hypothetical protein AMQ74_00348 [Candidatus Methanofastidiosum methylothiophilum]|uniref:Uncharacterized protein n=1 Tax=Candidatus Methanofastidiosum methylothiophilum TaxID=1705564 RepID=A0A150J8Y2_9EURY|nr:MAG: hypothetical protein AMQ74_00348 [Candidatus Methanofastidiosum methylthiophilus]